ncbi:MAG: hypothetical protein NC935_06435 [Candidatus Omnitrophica bacterium]|nr:hypothetical protein [Candidatus Omnitrophota bacterium]
MGFAKKLFIFFILILGAVSIFYILKNINEEKILKEIISRLTAETRIAQVTVTKKEKDPNTNKTYTTIKFVEYDTAQKPLQPKYFTFSTDIIYLEALVIRFEDFYIKKGHPLKGKSAYIFTRVFGFTDDKKLEIFDINKAYSIPTGYKVEKAKSKFQERIWQKFWDYALNDIKSKKVGIRSAQIEAPATKFIEGCLYTIKIEHLGGLRIDVKNLEN